MRMNTAKFLAATAALALGATASMADPVMDDELVIDGELAIITDAPAGEHVAHVFDTIYSGWRFRTEETRALQKDDFDNPGMVFVDRGLDRWNAAMGSADKSCADCHGDVESMKGVRAGMPKINKNGELWALENYINDCVTTRQGAEAWGWNSDPMKDMTSLISLQSRGMIVDVQIDDSNRAHWELGKEIYYTRYGQMELSCANCHEDNNGRMIRADHLSMGMANGFPTYRLKNAGIVPLHQRFRGCIRDTRGETFREGSDEFLALELYVMSRGNGLMIEGVSVRQ
jgi:sulfur-oxidizing protein SoxA